MLPFVVAWVVRMYSRCAFDMLDTFDMFCYSMCFFHPGQCLRSFHARYYDNNHISHCPSKYI